MINFFNYLKKMGGLHDAAVTDIAWSPTKQTLKICLDDLYNHFLGRPKNTSAYSGEIVLHGVSDIDIELQFDERLWVYYFLPDEKDPDTVFITFSPAGKIWARFSSVDYPSCLLTPVETTREI